MLFPQKTKTLKYLFPKTKKLPENPTNTILSIYCIVAHSLSTKAIKTFTQVPTTQLVKQIEEEEN